MTIQPITNKIAPVTTNKQSNSNDNTPKIINYLKGFNYKENFDFTVYCNGNYKKKWQEDSL